MSIDSKILNEGKKKIKIKKEQTPATNHKIWDYFSPSEKERSFLLLSTCDIWKRKRRGVRSGRSAAVVQHFSTRIPEGLACKCLYCLPAPQPRTAKHFAWSVHKSFLLVSKISAFNTLSVWGGKNLKSERMWSEVLTCLASYGIHNAEKRCGTFIRSQCEILEFGVRGRFIRATLARGYWTSSSGHACRCLFACLFVFIALLWCLGATSLWHRLAMPLSVLIVSPSLYQ